MNRRQFTQALAALFATPAVPKLPLAAPAAAPALPTTAYFWADYMTRLHARCTPEMLAPFFKADLELATRLHAQLVAENVLLPTGYAHPNLKAQQPARSLGQSKPQAAHSDPADPAKPHQPKANAPQQPGSDMPDTPLRPAQSEDLSALATLWHDGWVEAHAAHVPQELVDQRTLESFHIRMGKMLDETVVAGPIGAPTGFCAVCEDEIYQMYVSPSARGTGTAAKLINEGCQRIFAAGFTKARLDVIPQNPRAIAFYEKIGFEKQGVEVVNLDTLDAPFTLPCLVMTRPLSKDIR